MTITLTIQVPKPLEGEIATALQVKDFEYLKTLLTALPTTYRLKF